MDLSHINEKGYAKMVAVGDKEVTKRQATASGIIKTAPATIERIRAGGIVKGDVLTVAQVAGISAAKKTWELIPMCHNIPLSGCDIDFEFIGEDTLKVTATVGAEAKTGVEMEAITAVSVALITVYDMAKAIDRGMTIGEIRLEKKSGGKSGEFTREK